MAWVCVCVLAWRPRLRVDSVARHVRRARARDSLLLAAGGNAESVFLLVVHVEVEYGTCMYALL